MISAIHDTSSCNQALCIGLSAVCSGSLLVYAINPTVLESSFESVGTIGYKDFALLSVGALFMYNVFSCVWKPAAKPSLTLTAPQEIANPRVYFDQAYGADTQCTTAEMQNIAIQALLLQRPTAIEEALQWVDEMPKGAQFPQRDYALSAIAAAQAKFDGAKAMQIADQMTHMFYFVETVKQINPTIPTATLVSIVQTKFQDVTDDDLELILEF